MRTPSLVLVVSIVAATAFGTACSGGANSPSGQTGSGGSGVGTGGTGGNTADAGSGGSSATGGSSAGTGGNTGELDASVDATVDQAGPDSASDGMVAVDAINGTPDGGAYSRTSWTAQSVPPFPTGVKAMGQDLKYANAFDGNYNTRWSIGDTNSPAQTIGDQFTFDMQQAHVFKKILFWSGGVGGVGGPDSRDYPGALEASVSLDCQTFGPAVGTGNEPQPGCSGGAACSLPFTIELAAPATARCVRLTLTKRLKLAGGIWWGISELFVYP